MTIRINRLQIMSYVLEQDGNDWPAPKLGISWYIYGRHFLRLSQLKKTVKYNPEANFYFFFGAKYLTICFEWKGKNEQT